MPRLQFKRFAAPDEVRTLPFGDATLVSLDDATVGRAVWQPGWRWSTHLGPIMGTKSCEVQHLGHSLSGVLHGQMDDGQELDIPPDSIFQIPAGHDAWVVGDEPWVTVEWTSARLVGIGPESPGQQILATIVFTDIVGSTATLQRVGDQAWRELMSRHNTRMREELNTYRGREVKTTGDGMLAVFDSASRAIRCAAAMARSASGLGLSIRVGVHTGEVDLIGDDVRGAAVHTAARIMALAGSDEVRMSSAVAAMLESSSIALEDMGTFELKGIAEPRRVFRLIQA